MNKGIRSPRARKATKRRLAKEKLEKEKKLKNKTEEEIETAVNNEVALEDWIVNTFLYNFYKDTFLYSTGVK